MSESDDTDILLLIPPDLFTVASSESEEDLTRYYHPSANPIVNELLGHVQSLEDRLSAIETRDSSINPSVLDDTLTELNTDVGNDKIPDVYPEYYLESIRSNRSQLSTSCLTKSYPAPRSSFTNSSPSKNSSLQKSESAFGIQSYSRENSRDNMAFSNVNHNATSIVDQMSSDSLNLSQQLRSFNCNSARDANIASKAVLDKNYSINGNDSSPHKHNKNNYGHSLNERGKKLDYSTSLHHTSTPKRQFNFREDYQNGAIDNTKNSPDCKRNNESQSIQRINEVPLNTEFQSWQSQKLISLSDFWLPDSNKSEEEMLRIRLEEEKFRREHCEHLIQELQKKLLEQQEKVAVAIRVDKEKSDIILQFQTIWNRFKERWNILETDHNELQSSVETMKKHYENEIASLQLKINDKDNELSKLINLMSECEEKRDIAVKEKMTLLESHVDELEKYKSLVQTAENRCETIKNDYDKLNGKNQQLEQMNKSVQQELYKERLKNNEVRSEMTVIHKALDTCEAELIILRQEKENLLLKLKEEESRIEILQRKEMMLVDAVDNAKKSESLARVEMKALIEQQGTKRLELCEIYQNQVDEVVNIKLKEFQSQLDAAELTFQMELDAKQRAIAECAARKMKNIIDKHQIEINLLEEKHKEEKRLYDIRLSQTMKKITALETQLNAQKNAKSRLADQLHSLMEKQYHQALQIISKNANANCQQSNSNKFAETNDLKIKSEDFTGMPSYMEPVKWHGLKSEKKLLDQPIRSGQNYDESLVTFVSSDEAPPNKLVDPEDDIKKYIKMILQMQEPKKHFLENTTLNSSADVCREIPRKFYLKAEAPSENEGEKNLTIDSDSLTSLENKNFANRVQQVEKSKPPWK